MKVAWSTKSSGSAGLVLEGTCTREQQDVRGFVLGTAVNRFMTLVYGARP